MTSPAVLCSAIIAIVLAGAPPATAQDAARVSRLESEVQQLRAQLDEQNRRIRRLEAELARRESADPGKPPTKPAAPAAPAARAAGAQAPRATGPQPWHAAAAWDRVARGMTAGQAIAILGEPTAVESVDDLKTLFYRGADGAGVELRGIVNLRDDRVVAVVKPSR